MDYFIYFCDFKYGYDISTIYLWGLWVRTNVQSAAPYVNRRGDVRRIDAKSIAARHAFVK